MEKRKKRAPREHHNDKVEKERKYKVCGTDLNARIRTLRQIFNFVAAERDYFVTLNHAPHTTGYDPRLIRAAKLPVTTTPLRTRFYVATETLTGYRPGDKEKAELRLEERIGRDAWKQVLKLGGTGRKTLERGEHQRDLDAFGINLSVYEPTVEKAARAILGRKKLYPMVSLQGQSEPVLYHPNGRPDVIFEIKFDMGVGRCFDKFAVDVVEIEIEVKKYPKGMQDQDLEDLLDQSEIVLLGNFSDNLEPIYEGKAAALFKHLVGWRVHDKAGFEKALKVLPLLPQ